MDLLPDLSAGDRLRIARRAAGLTQEQLAGRAGVSIDTIRKLEQNLRQSMRVSTANSLARVIGVDTTALLLGTAPEERRHDPQLQLIRQAMAPAAHFTPSAGDQAEDATADVDALRRAVEDAWTLRHAGDFAALGAVLPGLIAEAQAAARDHASGPASAVLAKALQLGAHTMVQNQMEDLALLGLDHALSAARESGDPLLPAMMTNSVTWVFLRTGRLADAEHVAVATADSIEPAFRRSAPGHLAVYGGLLLSAATAAARHDNYDTARDLLNVAAAAAQRAGEDSTSRWTTVFGPTPVAMQKVQVEAAAGEWRRALDLARHVPLSAKTPISWKARFLLDVAHAQTQTHRDTDAIDTLRTVRRLAPGWMQRHGLATAITRERATGAPPRQRRARRLAGPRRRHRHHPPAGLRARDQRHRSHHAGSARNRCGDPHHPDAAPPARQDRDRGNRPRPHPPVPADAGPDAESGRGLTLVQALSKEWSFYFPPSGGRPSTPSSPPPTRQASRPAASQASRPAASQHDQHPTWQPRGPDGDDEYCRLI